MTSPASAFDLTTYPWPPSVEYDGPMTPTLFEAGCSCPMQAACRATQIYPRREDPFLVLGRAFHEALEHLGEGTRNSDLSAVEIGKRAIAAFTRRVDELLDKARAQPRWHHRNFPSERYGLMQQALGLAAKRLYERRSRRPSSTKVLIENPLTSRDGVLHGRPDCIEISEAGAVIIDFKTGDIDNQEWAPRYKRELLFYALLCEDVLGLWPDRGLLFNLAKSVSRTFELSREEAAELAKEALTLLQQLRQGVKSEAIARPGPHCRDCDYRPWCGAYWRMIRSKTQSERDIEFVALEVRPHLETVYVRGRTSSERVEIEGSTSACPGLGLVRQGATVRVLDGSWVKVGNLLSASVGRETEVFVRPAPA